MNTIYTFVFQIEEREYAGLVKELDHEEKLSASLILADQEVKMLENQRGSILSIYLVLFYIIYTNCFMCFNILLEANLLCFFDNYFIEINSISSLKQTINKR